MVSVVVRDKRVFPAIIAAAVAAFLLVPMLTSAPFVSAQSQQEDPCADVPRSEFEDRNEADEVHRNSIDCVDFYDISSGADAAGRFFRPRRTVSRGQMATFVINTLQAAGLGDRLPSGDAPDEFDDIEDSAHRGTINQLARIGVVRGTSGNRFEPNAQIRRDQMATFLLQATEWAYQREIETANSYFSDVRPTNRHFGNVNAAYEEGLVRGTTPPRDNVPNSGEYSPARNVLRQAMASFLSNLLRVVDGAPEQFCPPSPSPSASPSATPRPSGSATPRPSASASPQASASASPQASASASPQASASASPQASASATPQASASASASPTATSTGSPCAQPSSSPSPRPSASASGSPRPTASASATPTEDCELPVDPTGIFCPEPEPSATASASASASPSASARPSPSASATAN